jgi:hypothetical protein
VGAAGQTSGNGGGGYAHLHSGVLRGSNVNAYKASNYAYGYRVDPLLLGDGASIDPLGWGAPMGEDPCSYFEADALALPPDVFGRGALSIALFKPGEAFNYP